MILILNMRTIYLCWRVYSIIWRAEWQLIWIYVFFFLLEMCNFNVWLLNHKTFQVLVCWMWNKKAILKSIWMFRSKKWNRRLIHELKQQRDFCWKCSPIKIMKNPKLIIEFEVCSLFYENRIIGGSKKSVQVWT